MAEIIIVRGVSGSGKSTLGKELQCQISNSVVVEADQFFTWADGHYDYDRTEIALAHNWCQSESARQARQGKTVIVCNTFCRFHEIEFYYNLARLKGYKFSIRECTGRFPNVHGVPDEIVQNQIERYETHEAIQGKIAWRDKSEPSQLYPRPTKKRSAART
ncbi:AAA family ATPase [Vibrio sp. 10N.239.312.D08]|uniref:AAA family ATPase n=1 Tax=Vibrio sp. 10N.239.312.D08 TaxID=3229978 RepID=UPI00354DD05C